MTCTIDDLNKAWDLLPELRRVEARMRELHIPVPEPTLRCTHPLWDVQLTIAAYKREIREELLERHADAMRADLAIIASPALLDQLDAARVADSFRIDASVSVGLLRIVRELLA